MEHREIMSIDEDILLLRECLGWSREVRDLLATLDGEDTLAVTRAVRALLTVLPPDGASAPYRAAIIRVALASGVTLAERR
jgi:hypothetical protein